MRFPPSFLDEIRARLPVSAVVGKRVQLKKQGREWRGLSPFNAEKTPSFYVNDQKGFYHCFSSGKHGDQFTFLMDTEGLSFPEAVERLAGEAGVPMPKVSAETVREEQAKKTLHDVLDLAARYFEASLQGRIGAEARGYLASREIRPETIASFRIGYAPDERYGLRDHLAGKGVSREDMIAAGLLIHGEDIQVPFDRFRGRVMFPIEDMRGRVVAFGGRAMAKDAPAKYLNSPETALFRKGSIVFNGQRARKAAHETGRLVVVEGYVDVIALAQAGIGSAIAPLGTALTEDQLDLAWRMVEEPVLCFDGDKAGTRAAYRAIDVALPKIAPGKSLRFAFLPAGLDPDDLVRKRGREAMEEVLAAARPLADVAWERETAAADLSTPERRAAFEGRIRQVTNAIADQAVRRHYEEDMRARLRALFQPAGAPAGRRGAWQPRAQGGGRRDGPVRREPVVPSEQLRRSALMRGRAADWPMRDALIVAVMANHPALVERHAEAFAALDFDDPELLRLRDAILDGAMSGEAPDLPGMIAAIDRRGLAPLRQRLAAFLARTGFWFVAPSAAEEDAETTWLQMAVLHHRTRTLHKDLKTAETAFGLDPSEDNDARLRAIRRELHAAEGTEALVEGYGLMSGRPARSG